MKILIALFSAVVVCFVGYVYLRPPEKQRADKQHARSFATSIWHSIKCYCINVFKTSEDTDAGRVGG